MQATPDLRKTLGSEHAICCQDSFRRPGQREARVARAFYEAFLWLA
jgi:hypothetical protein